MSITAKCTSCGKTFEAPDNFAGKRVKCKACGTIFVVRGTTGDPELDSLADLDNQPEAPPPSSASKAGSKIGPRMETRMAANPTAGEFELDGPVELSSRANVLRFRYPGALIVDQWLPLVLIASGFIWLGCVVDQPDAKDVVWIVTVRYAVPVLLYLALVFPITFALVRKAGRDMRFRMPPSAGLRCFATYIPAFVMGTGFWWVGKGALSSLLLGALFGLVLSSAILWLLFRLRDTEIGLAAANGAAGFLISSAIVCGIILGLNGIASMAVAQSKAQASVPASPLGPGLNWFAPPAPTPTFAIHAKPLPTAVTSTEPPVRPHPASPLLSDLQSGQITGQVDQIIRPPSDGSLVAIVRNLNTPEKTIESWSEQTWQNQSGQLQLPGSPGPNCVLSGNGQHLAWIIDWPKLSAQVWSFPSARVMAKIDLDSSIGPKRQLLGFSSADRLLVRWGDDTGPTTIEVLSLKDQARVCKFDALPRESNVATLAISESRQRLAVVGRSADGTPTIAQFDLTTGTPASTTPIAEIDAKSSVNPTGLAYSADGKKLAILFENSASALILIYDTDSGKKTSEFDYPAFPFTLPQSVQFQGSALVWLDPSPALLLYGEGAIDTYDGTVAGGPNMRLMVENVVGQRVLANDQLELLTGDNNNRHISIATLDRAKLQSLLHGPSTQP
jgi:hypothetical protein